MYVSVLIPTFNRKAFSQLISLNIKSQSYPFIKEIIVADDIYHRNHLSTSIFNLIKTGKGLSGSSDMIMLDTATSKTYKQRCINMNMLNEATMVYTRKYAEANKFSNTTSSEGISFCKIADIEETRIEDIMVCLCHKTNTVDKSQWVNKNYEERLDMGVYKEHLELISKLIV